MKKGFTLIELLAVIVILAIIATIAVPIVLSIIEDAKESTTLRNAEYYLDAVEQSIAKKSLNIGSAYQPSECEIQEDGNLLCDEEEIIVEVKGKKPTKGTITFENGKMKDITIEIENKVVIQDEKGEFIFETNSSNLGGSTQKPVELKDNFADNTWSEIAYACQNNVVPSTWEVGNIKTMTLDDKTYNVTIIGKNHDTYADGGIAPLTFQTDIVSQRVINTENTTVGGWPGSNMNTYLNTELINSLEFKDNIKTVVKSTNKGYTDSGNTYATQTVDSNDKIFLLSVVEVFGNQSINIYNSEGTQYDFYANNGSKVKTYNGSNVWWWLRTPDSTFHYFFNIVNSAGVNGTYYANNSYGVSFGFCF